MSEETSDCAAPTGYVITYHEQRGYDSPNRWYSAKTKRGRFILSSGTYEECRRACDADKKNRKL